MGISVVLNTKNSVQTLERAIRSVAFADEVIVVDMQSTDGTPELAKQLGASVFFHKDVGYVEPARQFALEKAKEEWVLVLDADESIPNTLATRLEEIAKTEIISNGSPVAYALPRKNMIFSHWVQHAGWWPDYQIRFFKNGSVTWPDAIHSIPEVNGVCSDLPDEPNTAIEHQNYTSISEFVQRLDRYTAIQAKLDGTNEKPLTASALMTTFSKEFLRRAFAEHGISGGTHGMALSLLQSFSEVVRQLKRWELSGMKPKNSTLSDLQSIHKLRAELAYWVAHEHVQRTSGLLRFWWKIRRSFQV